MLEKILLREMSKTLLVMFFPSTFMVLSITFQPLVHFEFILAYGIIRWSSFIFFACICPMFWESFKGFWNIGFS